MKNQYIFFLGHQPHLSIAELEAVFGPQTITRTTKDYAILSLNQEISPNQIDLLGGTKSIAKIIKNEPLQLNPKKQSLSLITNYISEQNPTKLKLGISIYRGKNSDRSNQKFIQDLLQNLRRSAQKDSPELNLRTIEPKSSSLSSAQIIHSGLLKTKGLSLILIIDQEELILARTIQIQNLKKYTLRDYERPKANTKNGMLPPKLAQIMLNLSLAKQDQIILDPFCGSGTILQEALLAGLSAVGSDLNPKVISGAQKNLDWLGTKFKFAGNYSLSVEDATTAKWSSFDLVVSELYLGDPLTKIPNQEEVSLITKKCNLIAKDFLKNIHPQLKSGQRLVLAFPCWFIKEKVIKLPTVENLADLGYNQVKFKKTKQDLIYRRSKNSGGRQDQIVGRDIHVLTKN